jgi:hypothetical protein
MNNKRIKKAMKLLFNNDQKKCSPVLAVFGNPPYFTSKDVADFVKEQTFKQGKNEHGKTISKRRHPAGTEGRR